MDFYPFCPRYFRRCICSNMHTQVCVCVGVFFFLSAEPSTTRYTLLFTLSPSLRCFHSISPFCGCVSKGAARPRADLSTLFIFGVSFNSQRLFSILHTACFKARTSCARFAGVWMPVSNDVLWKKCFWFAVQAQNLLGYVWELSSKMIFNHRGINDICLRLHVLRKKPVHAYCKKKHFLMQDFKKWKSVSPAGPFLNNC